MNESLSCLNGMKREWVSTIKMMMERKERKERKEKEGKRTGGMEQKEGR